MKGFVLKRKKIIIQIINEYFIYLFIIAMFIYIFEKVSAF